MHKPKLLLRTSMLALLSTGLCSISLAQETGSAVSDFLVKDAKLGISTRTQYKENIPSGDPAKGYRPGTNPKLNGSYLADESRKPNFAYLAQGLRINYQSGYLFDTIGFGLSLEGLAKAWGWGANLGTANSPNYFTDGGLAPDLENFGRFGERFFALKFGDEKIGPWANGKIGWQNISNVGIVHARDSRLLPKMYRGVRIDSGYKEWSATIATFDAQIDRNQQHWEDAKSQFYSFGQSGADTNRYRRQIDRLNTAQIKWEPTKNNYLLYFGGIASNYIFREGLESSWFKKLDANQDVRLEAFLYHNKALGLMKEERRNYGKNTGDPAYRDNIRFGSGFDNNAWHIAFRGSANIDKFSLQGGITHTWAPVNTTNNGFAQASPPIGFFIINPTSNSVGRFMSPSYNGITDYLYDGETMLFANFGYKLFPELTGYLYGYYGTGTKYQGKTLTHDDIGAMFSYKPNNIKNLSVLFGYGRSHNWQTSSATGSGGMLPLMQRDGSIGRAKGDLAIFQLDYKYDFLK